MDETSLLEAEQSERVSPLRYLVVYVALVVLAVASLGVSRLHLASWGLFVAMAIAFLKATLVVLFFMHLWEHRGASRVAMLVAVSFIAVLTALAVADVALRFPIANPPSSERAREYMKSEGLPEQPPPNQNPTHQPIGR